MKNGRPSGLRVSGQPAAPGATEALEPSLPTQGEVEAALCQRISRAEQEYRGRGPKAIHAHLSGDLLVVRLRGALADAEQRPVGSPPAGKGRALLKRVRGHPVEPARPTLEVLIRDVTGVPALRLHHDVSAVTGEEVVLFALAESPLARRAKNE
jgi:uncharacterized protein YbcI